VREGARWRVGIDVGGTFIDVVAVSDAGLFRHAKTPTTARDRLAGLQHAIAAVGLRWPEVETLVHGTTMVTNALVEGRLARVALLTTAGFEDVLHIARASRDSLYRLDLPPRMPSLVPPADTFGVRERLGPDGEPLLPLADAEIARAVAWVRERKPDAVAVCLLHTYADGAHEARLAAALHEASPFVSISSHVSPEAREYERTSSTVLNAALMPDATAYLDRLLGAIPAGTAVQLFHSAGGMATPAVLRDLPLTLALSGPAAGASATAGLCRTLGIASGLAFDMGGTTTDVCLVSDGQAEIATNRRIGGRPIRQPMIAIESVGAGGGSIVRMGAGGLGIGPDSAGSDPGPACYGLGGTAPTITDANVVLGYLDPERLLGGSIRVDPDAARQALALVAAQLRRSVDETALGVITVANAVMARALARVTVQRGVDLRGATLIAFGGAGPMHAVSLARQVGITRVVVPAFSGAFSAFGCVTAPALIARQRTVRLDSAAWDAARFAAVRCELAAEARRAMDDGVVAATAVTAETALVRYIGQSVAVEVPYAGQPGIEELGRAFRAVHERLYGYATAEPFQVESLRVIVSLPTAAAVPVPVPVSRDLPIPLKTAPALFERDGPVATPRYDRACLMPDNAIAGPCIIEDAWSTIVLPPDAACRADAAGHLHIEA